MYLILTVSHHLINENLNKTILYSNPSKNYKRSSG